MKRVLIVSPHFPPINAPDMQRVRMSLPYYRVHGWEPVVLTVKPEFVEGVREPELLQTIPPDVRVVGCEAYPLERSRRFGIGNIAQRAWPFLNRTGAELLRRERYDLVFFSTTQFLALPLGRRWRRRFGVPYVIDVQDPWRTDYYARHGVRPPGGWKYQFARLQAALLEGWTFRRASGVISVSERYLGDLRARYPKLAAPMQVIPFGASRADLEHARALPLTQRVFTRRPGIVHFVYTGVVGPLLPAVTALLEAVRSYAEKAAENARRLRFHFYGTSYAPPGRGRPSVLPVADTCGVRAYVDEIPHRIGHLESLRIQAEADVLVLPGSPDPAYSPSKLYPYYLSGKPILALAYGDSVLQRVLHELACAEVVRLDEGAPVHGSPLTVHSSAEAALHRFFDTAIAGFPPGTLPPRNEGVFDAHYLAESLTRRQCALFEQAISSKR